MIFDEFKEENKLLLTAKRAKRLKTMRDQGESLHNLENNILATGLKASTIKEQNDKFIEAIKIFESEYATLDGEKIQVLKNKEDIENEYDNITGKFMFKTLELIDK